MPQCNAMQCNGLNGRSRFTPSVPDAVPYACPMQDPVHELQVINDDVTGGQSRSELRRTAAGRLISEAQAGPLWVELELPRAL